MNLNDYIANHFQIMPPISKSAWVIYSDIQQQIKAKIEAIGTPLKEWDININYGIKTGFNKAFIIDTQTKERLCHEDAKSVEIIKPILRGRDIKRYSSEWTGLWLIFIPWHFPLHEDLSIKGISVNAEAEFKKQYPAIYKHLLTFKNELSARNKAEVNIRYEWFALQRCAVTYFNEFEQEKLIYPNMTQTPCFSYANETIFVNDKAFILTTEKVAIKFLTAYLNSKVTDFMLRQLCSGLGEKGLEIRKIFIENLPIPKLSQEKQQPFIDLVDKILESKKAGKETSELENQIDRLVYSLYDLNEQEIKTVSNNTAL